MPDIRTTMSKADKASQSFFFSQLNIVFGVKINLGKNFGSQGDPRSTYLDVISLPRL